MTRWFVSRHRGAVAWARAQGPVVDRLVPHLDLAEIAAGDVVMGTLPVNIAAAACGLPARYLHLALCIPAD